MTINSTVVHQVSKELMASNTISEVNTSITYDYEQSFLKSALDLREARRSCWRNLRKDSGRKKQREVQRKCHKPLRRHTHGASMILHTCTDSHTL